VKVIVNNFMTFSHCEIEPGSRLNLVLGANGTGKSSFVCALCVGLGGHPKLLGRADSVKEFVRRGQKEGSTEIWIAKEGGGVFKIFRNITSANKSEFKINGKPATGADVKKVVSNYNIQLDNLCQFLPQDKVVEFARLKPDQLLVETEKALGDAHLYKLHQELIEVRNSFKEDKQTLDTWSSELTKLKDKNKELERDVERFKKREELMEKVHLREQKKPWMEYATARDATLELKDRVKAETEHLKVKEQELAQVLQPISEAESRVKKTNDIMKKARKEHAEVASLKGELQRGFDDVEKIVEETRNAIIGLAEEAAARQRRIEETRCKLEDAKAAVEQCPEPEAAGPEEDQLRQQSRDADYRRRTLEEEIKELNEGLTLPMRQLQDIKLKIHKMDDQKRQKLHHLEQIANGRYKGITKMWEWVQKNPDRFRGKVWGPIVTETSATDSQMAAFLEMQVSLKTWAFFVTEHREDQQVLMDECDRQLRKHGMIVATFAGDPNKPLSYKKGRAQDYAADGITHTLDQALKDTPAIITHILNDEANLTGAFVGSPEIKGERVDQLLQGNPKITTLYLADSRITTSVSRYNRNAVSKEVVGISHPRLLTSTASGTEKEALQQRAVEFEAQIQDIKQDIAAKEAEKDKAEQEYTGLVRELKQVQEHRKRAQNEFRKLRLNLKTEEKNLQTVMTEADPMLKEPGLTKQLEMEYGTLEERVVRFAHWSRRLADAAKKLSVAKLAAVEAEIIFRTLKDRNVERQQEVEALRAVVEGLRRELDVAKKRARDARQHAQEEAPLPEDPIEKEEFQAKMAELPQDMETLLAEIDQLTAEADAIVCTNPAVLKQFKERELKIKDLEEKSQSHRGKVDTQSARIEELKGQWLPELKGLVAKINETFRKNFAEIGCAGEVHLQEDEDFDKFEIQIRVKFRAEEELQILTSSRQSGGERSVCTILYLIALQGVTYCPFRVVDEINQGMDPNNERKVFKQLVECACRPDTPQCFLLTPKLLPDLPFSEDVRVLNIFNGPWVQDVAKSKFTMCDLLPPDTEG